MKHSNEGLKTDTYRVRLVLEKCIHTSIGNWRDTVELTGRIFFGVTNDKLIGEKDFAQGCKTLDSHDDLLEACKRLMEEANDGSARFDDPEPDSIYIFAKEVIAKAEGDDSAT